MSNKKLPYHTIIPDGLLGLCPICTLGYFTQVINNFWVLISACAYLYTGELHSILEVPICTLTVYKGVN